jgi:hypothetical protein|tara:strand:+ start:367 stop:936 length:570 start_codon:yes stop_codon:yes gene_type:complete
MEICKKIFLYHIFLFFLLITNTNASNFSNISPTIKDLILMKYEIFFLKNQERVINSRKVGLMVKYQSLNYELKIDKDNNTSIRVNAVMDKNRYLKKKKYKPKITDCNILRNKIVTNKYGYNPLTLKFNYSITEDVLFEYIKNNIFNLQNLKEDQITSLIDKTSIIINIIHPISKFSLSCSGKFSDAQLY